MTLTHRLSILQAIKREVKSVMISLIHKNFLDLDMSKTKELVIYFRTTCVKPEPSAVHGKEVDIVDP